MPVHSEVPLMEENACGIPISWRLLSWVYKEFCEFNNKKIRDLDRIIKQWTKDSSRNFTKKVYRGSKNKKIYVIPLVIMKLQIKT